jgi:hypothetical protein
MLRRSPHAACHGTCLALLGLGASGLALVGTGSSAAALEIILVRHADKDSQRGDYNLSPAGFRRAIDLARLIPACFGVPNGITTYFLDPLTSKNARSYQSAVPLAIATGAPIRIALNSEEASGQIGRQLRSEHENDSERLVLFWEHRRMPDLARGLGWSAMPPIADDEFDQLYVFRYRPLASSPQVLTYRQSRLQQLPCFRNAQLPWVSPQSSPPAARTR